MDRYSGFHPPQNVCVCGGEQSTCTPVPNDESLGAQRDRGFQTLLIVTHNKK